jgi:N4-gp56 family major capsid protein
MFAQKRTIPLNSGDQMVFRRYSTLSAATVPITDGTTPPGDSLAVTDFSTQIKWYGNFVTITDQVQFTVQDRVLNEATRVLSLQLGLTIDTLIRNMMVATASSILCSQGQNGETPTEITTADIKTAVRALRLGNARLMTKPIAGENRFATSPVRSSYWGFMDVTLQVDLEACADFLSAANYPNPMDALEAEWGSTNNVRWLLSTNGTFSGVSTPSSLPVWNNIILGQEAYGVVKLGSKEAEFIVKPLGSSGTADPLNQRGSVGYKYPFATRLLNDNWITRLLSTQRL